MNNIFKNTLFALSIISPQVLFSEPVITRTEVSPQTITTCTCNFRILPEVRPFLIEATPHITSSDTITVENTHYDALMIAFFEGKLEIYHVLPDFPGFKKLKKIFNRADKVEFVCCSDLEDPVLHTPEIKLEGFHFKDIQDFFVNSTKSIVLEDCLLEVPNVVLTADTIELMSFLINTQAIELKSNNSNSLLSKIKLDLKDKSTFDFPPFIFGQFEFGDNFMALLCTGVGKVEIQCLPGSFYLEDKKICF